MKRILHGKAWFDPGYIAVFFLALLAVWPFISRPGLPVMTDAELHVFRLAELSRLVREGELYPRWAPNFYYGFGYPIFNYYAPLSYYLALPIELLPKVSPVDAVKVIFVVSVAATGIGMYGYVRNNWGPLPGIIAGASYMFAPYIIFVDPHARGDLAEVLSFGIFALALWSLDNLRQHLTSFRWIVAALLVGALILSHNLMALVFFSILFLWAVWNQAMGLVESKLIKETGFLYFVGRYRLFFVLFLGLGLASFFWLPVLLEQSLVDLTNLVGPGSHFDFRNHFLSLSQLLSPISKIDWGASEPAFSLQFGLIQWILGGVGFVTVLLMPGRSKRPGLFFAIVFVALLVLMLPVSQPIWDNTFFLQFLQFPWRLLGPAAVMLAVLGGIGIGALLTKIAPREKGWSVAVIVALFCLTSVPLLDVPPWPEDFGPTTALRVLQEELSGRWLGTTSTADFVPSSVLVVPDPEPALLKQFAEEKELDRVNRVTIPDGTTVKARNISPLHFEYEISTDAPFLLRLFLFSFPGWEAFLNDEQVETELGMPEGFLVISIPPGNHQVDLQFNNTPIRSLSQVISFSSLIMLILVGFQFRRHGTDKLRSTGEEQAGETGQISYQPLFSVIVGLFLAYVIVLEPSGWLHHESTGTEVIPATNKIDVNLGGQIALLGYDLDEQTFRGGDQVDLALYWKAFENQEINYQVFVHLLDANGKLVAQSDKLNPGGFPTKWWPTDKYVRDEHRLDLPADLPIGSYNISVGLWTADAGWRLPIIDKNGRQVSDTFVLPLQIQVR